MFQTQHLQEKWSNSVLEHSDLPKIEDSYRRVVTTLILENQEKAMKEDRAFLGEVHLQTQLTLTLTIGTQS